MQHQILVKLSVDELKSLIQEVIVDATSNLSAESPESFDQRLVSIKDIEEQFNVSKPTIYRLISEDGLPSIKVGRKRLFRLDVVSKFFDQKYNSS